MANIKKHKKEIISVLSIVIIISLAVVGTLSYFTDSRTITNTFIVGKGVYIVLSEPKWEEAYPGGVARNIEPGQHIEKDPSVWAFGDDCWVRIKLTLKDLNDNAITDEKAEILFSMINGFNDDFVLDDGYSDAVNGIKYYNYKYILTADDGPKTLFTGVDIPDFWSMADCIKFGDFKIIVTAEAIQSAGFEDNQAEAFEALHDDWLSSGLKKSGDKKAVKAFNEEIPEERTAEVLTEENLITEEITTKTESITEEEMMTEESDTGEIIEEETFE